MTITCDECNQEIERGDYFINTSLYKIADEDRAIMQSSNDKYLEPFSVCSTECLADYCFVKFSY